LTSGPWESDERDAFRVRFDEDADAYDRTRAVAPEEVFDEILRRARLAAGSRIVEIGPGTGQATRPMAERGLQLLALEIGAHLAERARRNLAAFPGVRVLTTSFEKWDPDGSTFAAVFACNSLHWVAPEVRFAKAAEVLRPGGHLVVLATPVVIPEDADRFWWDVQDDWAAVGAERVDPSTKHPDVAAHVESLVPDPALFESPTQTRQSFQRSLTAAEFAMNLSTQSGVKTLPPPAREELLARIRRRVEAGGGWLKVHHVAVLTVAKKAA
jgi:SAM-dependent methyltransferase